MVNMILKLERDLKRHNELLNFYGLKRESENKEGFLNTYVLRCDYEKDNEFYLAGERVYHGIVGMISGFPKVQAIKYEYVENSEVKMPSHFKIVIIDKK